MGYDRARVKQRAKEMLRGTDPRHWLVTLVYLLITSLPSLVVTAVAIRPFVAYTTMLNMDVPIEQALYAMLNGYAGPTALLTIFLSILVSLFSMVMQFGYLRYCMNVERGQEAGFHDLFSGFAMTGRVLALNLLILLFSFLWGLVAFCIIFAGIYVGVMASSFLLFSSSYNAIIGFSFILIIAAYAGGLFFLYSRILRYEMANYVLLDHPEYSASQALEESKELMKGRRWSYFVMSLSFFGWVLLDMLIVYGILYVGGYLLNLGFVRTPGITYTLAPYYALYAGFKGIALFLAARLCAAPLDLWLTAYQYCSYIGFYDSIPRPAPPPLWSWSAPPAQPPAQSGGGSGPSGGNTPPPPPPPQEPPEPPADSGPAGSFYTGFVPRPPEEPEKPRDPDEDPWDKIE